MKPKLKHELRTPRNHILGYCEMLLEETRAAEVGEWHRGLEQELYRIDGPQAPARGDRPSGS